MKKRLFSIVISMLLLMEAVMPGLSLAATEDIRETVKLDVSVIAAMDKRFDSVLDKNDTTTVTIASQAGDPLPDTKTLTFSSDDSGKQFFEITYDKLGVYRYEIIQDVKKPEEMHSSATSYDAHKYLWTVYVLREETGIMTTQVLKIEGEDYKDKPKEKEADFTNTYAETHATVKKEWDDNDNQDGKRPDRLLMTLSDGKTVTLDKDSNWTGKIAGLPALDKAKQPIQYTWTEESINEYSMDEEKSDIKGKDALFVNRHTPGLKDVTVTKIWDDNGNQDGMRKAVELVLTGSAKSISVQPTYTITIEPKDGEDRQSKTIQGVPVYMNGQELTYILTEKTELEGYEKPVYDQENYTVTNKHTPEKIDVSGQKTWVDGENENNTRPASITVKLMNGEKEVASQVVRPDSEGKWTYTFENVDKYEDGKLIDYKVAEVAVSGYRTKADGMNLTNTILDPEDVTVSGKKTWNDANNMKQLRPTSIVINLLADGKQVDSKTVTEKDQWSWSFTGLKKYNDKGAEIKYTIEETPVEGYKATVTGYDVENFHKVAHLTITKKATSTPKNGNSYGKGETITYQITVTNDGNVPIYNITVTDELTEDERKIDTLIVGDSETFTTKYTVTEADVLAGKVLNVATGTGEDPDGDEPEVVPGTDEEPTVGHMTIADGRTHDDREESDEQSEEWK